MKKYITISKLPYTSLKNCHNQKNSQRKTFNFNFCWKKNKLLILPCVTILFKNVTFKSRFENKKDFLKDTASQNYTSVRTIFLNGIFPNDHIRYSKFETLFWPITDTEMPNMGQIDKVIFFNNLKTWRNILL